MPELWVVQVVVLVLSAVATLLRETVLGCNAGCCSQYGGDRQGLHRLGTCVSEKEEWGYSSLIDIL